MAEGQQGGQDIQGLIKVLKKKGMSSSELMQLFGPMLGVGGASNNYDDLFAQYMPTFGQINQSEPENSLRRSIAAEVMAGTPIWQIEEGIANAITSNDPGVSPSARYEDYVSLAKTLTNEYQNYNTQTSKPGNQSVFDKYNIPRPEERYTVETMFPDVIAKLAGIEKSNPLYKTGAVGSGAVLPERVSGDKKTQITSGTDAAALLKLANSAMNKAENFQIGGVTYDPEALRDTVIPQLEQEAKSQKDQLKRLKVLQDRYARQQRTQLDAAGEAAKGAGFLLNTMKSSARDAFQSGGITGDEYKQRLTAAQQKHDATLKSLEKLKGQKAPTDLYGLLKATEGPNFKPSGPNFSAPSTASSKFTSTTSGPGGYVGPAGGESTMARTFDPYAMDIAKGVLPALQEKIDKSGRTPQMDAIYRLLQSGLIGK
jgi:hypothetical protein